MNLNLLLVPIHIAIVCGLTLFTLRFGKEMIITWLSLLVVIMNLFVLKQITFFNLSITPTDALSVGYLLGLNLIQEFFGKKTAHKTVWISLFISVSFVILAQIHLAYLPNSHDLSQTHFIFLLKPLPRLMTASLISFVIVQFFNLAFFRFLQRKMSNKYLTTRTILTLILSQIADTVLFNLIGLYGIIANTHHVILFSLMIKGMIIIFSTPFVYLSRQVIRHEF
ncbi:MAG: queuosine precursor transporter [Chlamydiales bacterium]